MSGQRKKLFTQGMHYAVGNFLGMVLGIVTLAIYARLFTVEEYGIYSLVALTFGILQVVSLAGLPQAAIRFYWKYEDREEYARTIVRWGVSLASAIAFLAVIAFLVYGAFRGFRVARLLLLVAAAIPFGAIVELCLAFLRARQASITYNAVAVGRGVAALVLSLALLFRFERSLSGLFAGRLVGEALTALVAWRVLSRQRNRASGAPESAHGSSPSAALQEALRFGLPLLLFFGGSSLLSSGDRYLIELFLGHAAVGTYSLGYSMAERVMNLALIPTYLVAFPIYTERWEKDGVEPTRRFLQTAIRIYAGLVLPLAVGVTGVGRELIQIFATEKFLDALVVFPYVSISIFLYGLTYLTAAGLHVAQRTGEIARIMLLSGAFNVVVNLVLLPRIGILGAAIATLLGYALFAVLTAIRSRQYLPIAYPLGSFAKAGIATAVLWIFLRSVQIESPLLSLTVKGVGGAALYLVSLAMLDRDFRRIGLEFTDLIRARHSARMANPAETELPDLDHSGR